MNYRQSKNHSFYLKPDPSFIRNPFPQAFNFDSTPLLIRGLLPPSEAAIRKCYPE